MTQGMSLTAGLHHDSWRTSQQEEFRMLDTVVIRNPLFPTSFLDPSRCQAAQPCQCPDCRPFFTMGLLKTTPDLKPSSGFSSKPRGSFGPGGSCATRASKSLTHPRHLIEVKPGFGSNSVCWPLSGTTSKTRVGSRTQHKNSPSLLCSPGMEGNL